MQQKNDLSYRPDIDGLRAIAVCAVVGYHAFPEYVSGGFVGVDIFFVISGFLISSIVLKNTARGTFSLSDFYARRIRRIFPALMTVFVACLLAGWLLMFPDELVQLGKHVVGASLFIVNFIFLSEAGYFDIASELKPLLHLWSLSIEEQFYALWPLMLLFFAKKGRPALATFAVLLVSFLLCVVIPVGKTAIFYLPITRIWELLCGALLAVMQLNVERYQAWTSVYSRSQRLFTEIVAIVGMICLAAAIFLLNKKTPFPGFATLLPTLGTTLLITTGPSTFTNRYVLGNRLFVFVGLISYSLYLWHWPLLSFPKITDGLALPVMAKVIAIILAIILSITTYFFIEKPLRHKGSKTVASLLVLAAIIAGIGLFFYSGLLQPKQAGGLFQKIADAKKDVPMDPAFSKNYDVDIDKRLYTGTGSGPLTTLYVGDSNMDQYWPAVSTTLVERSGSRKALLGGCHIPVPHVILRGEELDCNDLNRHAYAIAANHADIDTIVIAARWVGIDGFIYVDGKQQYPMNTAEGLHKAIDQLALNISDLTRRGKVVYLILNIPEGPEFEPHDLMRRTLKGFNVVIRLEGGISLHEHQRRTKFSADLLRDVAKRSGAIVLDPADFLCKDGWCSAVTGSGDPIYRDSDHLRGSFNYFHPEFIAQTLE